MVYKAKQKATGQLVAIKKLLASKGAEDKMLQEQRARFIREMELIGRLRNPHVVQLIDAGFEEGNPYMVLEFVEGEELTQRLKRGPLSPKMAQRIVTQVLEGLAEAHDHGIVHRDLKPDNIMLIGQGYRTTAKVLDFGIAGVEEHFKEDDHKTITQFGQIRGTPHYMAPEQFQLFDEPRVESDVYAIGLILLECMTGNKAVQGSSLKEICQKQMQEPVDIPSFVLATPLGQIIARAVDKLPDNRYRTADEMLQSLLAIDDLQSSVFSVPDLHSGATVTMSTGDLTDAAGVGGKSGMIAAVLAVLLIGGGLAAYFALGSSDGEAKASAGAAEETQEAETQATQEPDTQEPPLEEKVEPEVSEGLDAATQQQVSGLLIEALSIKGTNPTKAKALFEEALALDPENATAQKELLPVMLLIAGKAKTPEERRDAYAAVLERDASNLDATQGLAVALIDLGEHDQAVVTLRDLLEHSDAKRASDAVFYTAVALEKQKKKKDALELYERYVKDFPDQTAHRSEAKKGIDRLEEKKPKKITKKPDPKPSGLSDSQTKPVFKKVASKIKKCRHDAFGKVKVKLEISPSGSVKDVSMSSSFRGTKSGKCVDAIVSKLDFPSAKGSTTADYTYDVPTLPDDF